MTTHEMDVRAALRLSGHNTSEANEISEYPEGMVIEMDADRFGQMPSHKVIKYMNDLSVSFTKIYPNTKLLLLPPGVTLAAVTDSGQTTMRFVNQLRELADKLEAGND